MPLTLEQIRKGSNLDGDSGSDPSKMPDWMDVEKFRRGQEFFQRHISPIIFILHCSLTLGFSIINLLNPLVFTNKSNTPPKARLRYFQTFVHLVLWHTADVWDTNTIGHKSVQLVRKMHRSVRESMNKRDPTTVHVSQYDMSLVQAGFMAAIVMYPLHAGVKCSRRELEDYIFFWRGIGYLLGIRDEYNVCSGDYAETYAICKEIEVDVMLRGLRQPPDNFLPMSDAYVAGVKPTWQIFFSKESIISISMQNMGHALPGWVELTVLDRISVFLLRLYLAMIRWCPGYEQLMNYLTMKGFRMNLNLVEKQFSNYNK